MANYNSGRIYNKILSDGGANYNSGPFTVVILDSSIGVDQLYSLLANASIGDTAAATDSIMAVASLGVLDTSSGDDSLSIEASIDINELGFGFDEIFTTANIVVSDTGLGTDSVGNIAMAFFFIDSHNILQPLGVLVTRDSRYELLPATRDNVEEIPGVHGEIDFGTEFQKRTLELSVATNEGYAPLEKSQLQRLFAKYLDPTKGAKTLIFSDDVEKTYLVKYSGKIDLTQYATWFPFVIPFKMSDPVITGSFNKSLTGSGTAVNEGTFEAPFVVEVVGPVTNPSWSVGGSTMAYTGTISSGQTLTIDTKARTAKIGTSNAFGNYNKVFPLLPVGSTTVTSSSNITIRWKDRWI